MTALSEALVHAQRRPLVVLERAYIAKQLDSSRLREHLDEIGCTDTIDQDYLLACLDTMQAWGASLPAGVAASPADAPPTPASDRQLALIAKLTKERGLDGPALPLTKDEAHEWIDKAMGR